MLLGNGDGTFHGVDPAECRRGMAWKLVVGEVSDVTHIFDVAVGNGDSDNAAILLGNRRRALAAPQVCRLLAPWWGAPSAIWTATHDLDWVLSSFSGQKWTLYTSDGSAGRSRRIREFTAENNPSCAIIVDLDNDGDLDLALTDEIADKVTLLRNVHRRHRSIRCPAESAGLTVSGKAL